MSEIQNLLQYLLNGDILGFIQAAYTSTFLSADIFYAVLSMLLVIPIYIRTKSMILLSIIWILLGSLFIIAMPLVSGVAIILLALGIGSLLYQIYMHTRGSYG